MRQSRGDAAIFTVLAVMLVFAVSATADEPRPVRRVGVLSREELSRVCRMAREIGLPEVAALVTTESDAAEMEKLAATYAAEAHGTTALTERRLLVEGAEKTFAVVIAEMERSASAREADRTALARCRVAWASTVLRVGLSRELDRQEITSGLAPPGESLATRLEQCIGLYQQAGAVLSSLEDAMAKDEERFLLTGLSDSIHGLRRECRVNLAWARTWRAGLEQRASLAVGMLTEAVRGFDEASKSGPMEERQGARLGMATALRMLRRYDDALMVLEKLKSENVGRRIGVRTEFERGRTLIAAERYVEARAVLKPLASVDPRRVSEEEAGVRFYLLIAPLLMGDSFLLESARGGKADIQRQGVETLTGLLSRGGEWPEYVDIYLRARGVQRVRGEQTVAELTLEAQRAMEENRYSDAIPLWQASLARQADEAGQQETNYNLGVCLFQVEKLDAAATAFEIVANVEPRHALSESAAGYAYRCRAQSARELRGTAEWAALAKSCRLLVERFPKHVDAKQAAWLEPLALQEAHLYGEARAAYERVDRESEHYWEARVNRAACRQAELESSRVSASSPATPKHWNGLADEWMKLGDDLEGAIRRGDARAKAEAAHEARLNAADVLASEACGRFRDALTVLATVDAPGGGVAAARGRALAIRVRCHRGLGQFEQAAAALDEYLKTVPAEQVGDVLLSLSAGMEAEVERLLRLQRSSDARRVAMAAVPTLRELLAWMERQSGREKDIPVVRMSLVRMLEHAGQVAESLLQLDRLMTNDPGNGAYLHRAARLTEQLGRGESGAARTARLAEAERLWSKLLSDANLRSASPDTYWEARYRWLRLRLEGGHADEVARGIAAEQAWVPDLGGAPWQGRLLELAEEARRRGKSG